MSCAAISSASAVSSSTASASVSSSTGLTMTPSSGSASGVHQGARGGAGGVGDLGTGQHAGDLLLAVGEAERLDGGAQTHTHANQNKTPERLGAGGDLRRVGDD